MNITIDKLQIDGELAHAIAGALLSHASVPPLPAATGLVPAIGTPWAGEGGLNGGLMRGIAGGRDYWLILAEGAASKTECTWGGDGQDESGALSDHDGLANTRALAVSKYVHAAAKFAAACRVGGKDDWYLPSRREWRVLVGNVPELFEPGYHWSSTQFSRSFAWAQDFVGGLQSVCVKGLSLRVRLVRRLFL